jgi:hypothetical protein
MFLLSFLAHLIFTPSHLARNVWLKGGEDCEIFTLPGEVARPPTKEVAMVGTMACRPWPVSLVAFLFRGADLFDFMADFSDFVIA